MRNSGRAHCYALPVFACLISLPSLALAEGAWSFSSGLDYSSGTYGKTERSESWNMPFAAKYDADTWLVRLSIPYLKTLSPSGVVGVGSDQVTISNGTGSMRWESGWGDVVLGGSKNIWQSKNLTIDLAGKIKFGTANESKGLGTGKNDYTVQLDAYQKLSGEHTVFGSFGARKMGDPDGVNLNDPLLASLGWSFRESASTSYGLIYDFRQRLQDRSADVSELSGFVSYRISPTWKMQTYLVKGFSTASPDFGGGVIFSYAH
jgi:hypothetical protein